MEIIKKVSTPITWEEVKGLVEKNRHNETGETGNKWKRHSARIKVG